MKSQPTQLYKIQHDCDSDDEEWHEMSANVHLYKIVCLWQWWEELLEMSANVAVQNPICVCDSGNEDSEEQHDLQN